MTVMAGPLWPSWLSRSPQSPRQPRTARKSRPSDRRSPRRLPARLAAVLVTALAAVTAWGLVAPTVSDAAVTVQRLGYCGGDDWEPAVAVDGAGHIYVLITHYQGDAACDPAGGLNNSRIMIQVSSDGGQTFTAPRVVSAAPGESLTPARLTPRSRLTPPAGMCM